MKKVISTFLLSLAICVIFVGPSFAQGNEHIVLNEEQLLIELRRISLPLHGKKSDKRNCMGFNAFELRDGGIAYMGAGHCFYEGYFADPQGNRMIDKVRFPLGKEYFIAERKTDGKKVELGKMSFAPLVVGESYYTFGQISSMDPVSSLGILWMVYSGTELIDQTNTHTFWILSRSVMSQMFTPGLSGSPILNKYGEVVAIGTAKNLDDWRLIAGVPLMIIEDKISIQ